MAPKVRVTTSILRDQVGDLVDRPRCAVVKPHFDTPSSLFAATFNIRLGRQHDVPLGLLGLRIPLSELLAATSHGIDCEWSC